MKKTKTIEVTVCDVCGVEDNPRAFIYVEGCDLCDADVCIDHIVNLEGKLFCRTHIDLVILKKLGG